MESLLQPLDRTLQEARERFMSGQGVQNRPSTSTNDNVLISLNKDATEMIHVINPGVKPYQVYLNYPSIHTEKRISDEEKVNRILRSVENFVGTILHPTALRIYEESAGLELTFVYGYSDDAFETLYFSKAGTQGIPTTIEYQIMTQMTDITRKGFICAKIYSNTNLGKEQQIPLSEREKEIIRNSRGYEKR